MPISPVSAAVCSTEEMNASSWRLRRSPHSSRTEAGSIAGVTIPAWTASSKSWKVGADDDAQVVPPGIPAEDMLSIYGGTGVTAYFGLLDVGKLVEGDTVVVSGAAGAVGSVAG